MKKIFSLLVGAVVLFHVHTGFADEASHRQSAEALLGSMGMEKLLAQSVDQMLQMQVKQNPAIAPFQTEMRGFLDKYMSWESMKADMIKAYTEEFTEQELKDLTAFYQTPLGQKTVQKMPSLMSKGAELGQRRIQEHLPELQAAIAAKGAAAAGAGAAAAPQTAASPKASASASASPAKK